VKPRGPKKDVTLGLKDRFHGEWSKTRNPKRILPAGGNRTVKTIKLSKHYKTLAKVPDSPQQIVEFLRSGERLPEMRNVFRART
jgi:hypothetical protein